MTINAATMQKIDQDLIDGQQRIYALRASQAAQGRAAIDAYAEQHPVENEALRAAERAVHAARQRLADAEQRLASYNSTPPVDAAGVAAWASQRAALAGAIDGYSLLVDQALAAHARLSDIYRAALSAYVRTDLATARAQLDAAQTAGRAGLIRRYEELIADRAALEIELVGQYDTTIAPLVAAAELLGIDARPVVRLAA